MLKFIKNLFDKQPEKIAVDIDELPSWFDEHARQKIEAYKEEMEELSSQFKKQKKELEKRLELIAAAQLVNDKISLQEKNYMEGNRTAYINKVSSFIEQINLPENNLWEKFFREFALLLEELTKGTGRSDYILQNFFAHELRETALAIKALELSVQEMKDARKKHQMPLIESIKTEIREIDTRKERLFFLMESANKKRLELTAYKRKVEDLEKEKKTLLESQGYKEELLVLSTKDELLASIKRKEEDFKNRFAALDRALRKYQHIIIDDKDLLPYLEDPISALLSDTHLAILGILTGLRTNVDDGTIEVKNKEDILRVINGMDKGFLDSFMIDRWKIQEDIDGISRKLAKSAFRNLLKDIDDKIEHTKKHVVEAEKDREKLITQTEEMESEDYLSSLQRKLRAVFDKDITIVSQEESQGPVTQEDD